MPGWSASVEAHNY